MLDRLQRRLRRARLSRQGVTLLGAVDIIGLVPLVKCDGEVSIGNGAVFMCRQGPRIVLQAHRDAVLSFGPSAFVNQSASIIATAGVRIGANAKIGPHVVIHDTFYHEVDQGEGARSVAITIGDNVWIGRGSVILPGIEIGDHSVIGTGSVVTHSVPARTVVAGNPARVVREVRASDGYVRP